MLPWGDCSQILWVTLWVSPSHVSKWEVDWSQQKIWEGSEVAEMAMH